MTDLASYYHSIKTEEHLNDMISNNIKEDLYLEFKQKHDTRDGLLHEDDKFNFSRALSGFANSDGGILIWGIKTNRQDESAEELKPITNVDEFIRSLKSSLLTFVQPTVDNVLIEKIQSANLPAVGYVKCFIPQSEKTPHRGMFAKREYYKRSTEGFYRLEHFDLEDMFGRRQKPLLELIYSTRDYPGNDPEMREITFSFKNEGRAIARYFGIACKFTDNIELVGSVDRSMQDISDVNDGQPFISHTNNDNIIHPNNMHYIIGSMRYKRKDKTKKIGASVSYYCEGMMPRSKEIEIE